MATQYSVNSWNVIARAQITTLLKYKGDASSDFSVLNIDKVYFISQCQFGYSRKQI